MVRILVVATSVFSMLLLWCGKPQAGKYIDPRRFFLEANLGPVPIDIYTSLNQSNGRAVLANCSQSWTIQMCFQNELKSYANQQVSGVRFMFGVTGGGFSTAMDATGNLQQPWFSNFATFLQDVAASGITNVTPTPSWGGWGGDPFQTISLPDSCTGQIESLAFFPAVPYGRLPQNFWPVGPGVNDAYTCSPTNPIFVGWPKLYLFIDGMLSALATANLNVNEFDLVNEINVYWFTVQARYIYDPTYTAAYAQTIGAAYAPGDADVLGTVRGLLKLHGFNPGVATYSIGGPTRVTRGLFDCLNAWGESARIVNATALWAAFAGPNSAFGHGPNTASYIQNNLVCDEGNFVAPTMVSLPQQYDPPTVLDIHDYSLILNASNVVDLTIPETVEIQDQMIVVRDIDAFLRKRPNITTFFVGETFSSDMLTGLPPNTIQDKLQGYIESMDLGTNAIIRPWANGGDATFAFPQNFQAFQEIVKATPSQISH